MEDVKILDFLKIENGSGSGSGDGSGSGSGSGSGYGYGSGSGSDGSIKSYNGQTVYKVDDVPTLIDSVRHGIARGSILGGDLTLTPCYIVKQNNIFAHGETLREAQEDLLEKLFDDMPEEERIEAFVKEHPDNGQAYQNHDLFDWHHRLTGSCEMGRNAFVKNHGLDLDGSTTVQDFILLTEHDYGGSIIKKLRQYYKMEELKT